VSPQIADPEEASKSALSRFRGSPELSFFGSFPSGIRRRQLHGILAFGIVRRIGQLLFFP
jgi:hypothetical protein